MASNFKPFSRYVKPSFAPRIAAQDAPNALRGADEEAVFLKGEARVAGAAGRVTTKAPWKEVTEPRMVR
mgnify:CR=1 FL=1